MAQAEVREGHDFEVRLTKYMPCEMAKNKVYVCPQSAWVPDDEGYFQVMPFQFASWDVEAMSWHDTCSLTMCLNPFGVYEVKGEQYLALLEATCVNTFRKFPVGKARHTIIADPTGKDVFDGIIIRRAEDTFIASGFLDPAMMNSWTGNAFQFESRYIGNDHFFFQLCGPRSLEIVEQLCRQDLHDLEFMYSCDVKVEGKDCWILRTGMAGTLAYEVHGNIEDVMMVYNKIKEVGEPYGIQDIGARSYMNQHTEGSIFQLIEHFNLPMEFPTDPVTITGSLPRDSQLQWRTPYDCGWGNLVRFNHEFTGKEALLAESQGHHNAAVTLIWNKEDVVRVMAGVMDPDLRYDLLDPVSDYDFVHNTMAIHLDGVYDGDRLIGASSGRTLVAKTRDMISVATIDEDYAVQGTEVEVLWGNPGTNQTRIRATVDLFPYIKEDRNDNFDIEKIPHPVFD